MSDVVRLRPRRQLTASQELIWTSQRLHPDVPLANMASLSLITGRIDAERFVAAVDRVVAGSDALRLTVRTVDGTPHPVVQAEPPVRTEVISLPITEVDQWARQRIRRPLDVAECVYDSVLIEHGEGEDGEERWSWWMDIHHIATDAASSALVFRAVSDAYHDTWLPPMSYESMAEVLAELQGTARWQRTAEFWHGHDPAVTPTELYRPDTGAATHAERTHVDMSAERRRRLDDLLDGRFRLISPDLSLTAVLATAVVSFLHRLNDTDRVTIGMPVHNRPNRESKSVIGPLVELFPLVVDVERSDTFAALHERVTKALMTMLGHAQPGTSPRQNFDVVLNVHGATFGRFGDMPTHHRWVHPGHIDAHHRLRVQALDYDGDGQLELALDINHRVAGPDHRNRAGQHFEAVIDAMVTDPDRELRSVSLITPDELLLLQTLNRPGPGSPLDAPAPDLIRRQLDTAADRPVLSSDGDDHTGAEVNQRIEDVARSLNEAGIGRGDLVGIEIPLGVEAVIAIHGVLRAGAAFVPIDPSYPAARRQYIENDSGALMVLRDLADLDSLTAVSAEREPSSIHLDDLAYVIYTSGSTGTPKGVPISHRGLAEYLGFAHRSYIGETPPVMPLYTSLSFDLTITTLFLPWLASGLMTVHPAGGLTALRDIVDEGRATLMKATPSHLELLVRMIGPDHRLRGLIVGGEAFMADLADQLLDVLGDDLAIYNEYGPTEAVVGCMIHRYDPTRDPGPEVPIGGPAPGVSLHVLDAVGHPAPLGVAGELFISRPGMATGYLGRPELSGQRFLPSNIEPGTLLYRTGDRVRMLDADRMVYLGRFDTQIKIGGIRTEAGEIESAARTFAGVKRAVAALWSPDPDQRVEYCIRCGLASNVPGIAIDGDGVCSACHEFDVVAPQAEAWFRTEADLLRDLGQARERASGEYDVVHLLSGGKDSTYALYRLVEMGAKVYALTLDNGFVSDGAKANIDRATTALDVTHEYVTVDGMNDIFRDSLERFSNVCNGCYKTIYTVALERADRLGIPAIVTGLSRGQFFETRLVPGLFGADRFDPDAIDEAVDQARRVYHSTPDAVSEHLDVEFLQDGSVLDAVQFIDFYRYVDVELAEMYEALDRSGTWLRPEDTGRSTNCLVNSAGIYVHKIEQAHHNYALPYSWDVRLGHKTRDEAMFELDDPMDAAELASITSMLAEIGYEPRSPEVLTLWIEVDDGAGVDVEQLRRGLAEQLPTHAVPQAIEIVDSIPLTTNGKVDFDALPPPSSRRRARSGEGRAPDGRTEVRVASVWQKVLGVGDVSADEDFFSLGGTSLHALEMIVRVSDLVGVTIPETLAFRHRTIAELAAAIDELASAGSDRPVGEAPPDRRREQTIPSLDDSDRPLSAGEEALLFEWRRDPTDLRYNVGRLYRVSGGYDRDRFDEAVRAVVAHQPVLHTSYGPSRKVLETDQALHIGRQSSEHASLDRLADELHKQRFDLINGPLVTVHHLTSGVDDDAGIMIRAHHISTDAGSLDVLWRQIDTLYRGDELPELGTTYAAHGQWQRARMPEPASVWPLEPETEVGTLALKPVTVESDGYVEIPAAVSSGALRSAPGTTVVTTALAALAATLDPFHDRSTFELAITASMRDHALLEEVAGYFTNPMPLLTTVPDGATYAELAERTGHVLSSALPNRTVPFADVARSARERGAVVPQSKVMLSVEDLAPAELDGREVSHRVLSSGLAVNDLTFFLLIRGERIDLGCEYRGSVVGRDQAAELLDVLNRALSEMTSAPKTPVADLVHGPRHLEGAQLADDSVPVPGLIAEVIANQGNDIAVSSGEETLTYAELDQRAHAIAARLRAVGVTPGDRVAVVLPRSVDLPVAIWATWLLGASYVPIDISQPAARVAELVAASGAAAALTAGENHAGLSEVTTVRTDVADDAVLPISRSHEVSAGDEAYVIFTSGSTGRPKGVSIDHGNLARSLAARLAWYGEPVERYLLISSAGFDSSVAGLFWTLVEGAELLIPTENEVHDIDALLVLIENRRPGHTLCVPSLYGAMLNRRGGPLEPLRTVIVAGEACTHELVELHHGVSGARLVNEYGPTEATVWATAHGCRADERLPTVPIGRPIPGVTAAVLRESTTAVEDRSVPVDVAGELWIGGDTVSTGYIGSDDELSDGNPFHVDDGGRRWYQTGDRVVRRAEGVLEFLGRIDEQLSIGGVRIEPAEIEHALTGIEGVGAALVADRDGRLRAWVEVDRELSGAELLDVVADRVAPTHVPKSVMIVDELPRSTNGKIDRRRAGELPVERASRPETRRHVGAPDSVTERVVTIFSEAFEGEPVAADSDFFELGGDSLRAVVLVSLLEQEFGRRVGIGELVDAPTPARLADRFRDLVESSGTASTLADSSTLADPSTADELNRSRQSIGLVEWLRSTGDQQPLVLLPPGGGNLLRYAPLVGALDDRIPVVGLRLPGADAVTDIATTIEEQARVMLEAMDAVVETGPYRLFGWSTGGLISWEMAHMIEERGDEVELVALVDTFMGGMHIQPDQSISDKYASLYREEGVAAVAMEGFGRFKERTEFALARRRYRQSREKGETPDLQDAERQLGPVIRRAAIDYECRPLDVPCFYFSASESEPEMTVNPWIELQAGQPRFRVVTLEGVHFEPAERCIIGPDRVGDLVAELGLEP